MKINEKLKQNAKVLKSINENTLALLKTLTLQESFVDFQDLEQYDQLKILVKEGYVTKTYRKCAITEKGKELLECNTIRETSPEKFEKLLLEKTSDKHIEITYKVHNEEKNIIRNEVAIFNVSKDGLPIVQVDEESYANLIHRTKGQHWKQYLGEEGRQLIRQKKVQRFYVESKETGRKYLYIVE
jgi:hypothetical protein